MTVTNKAGGKKLTVQLPSMLTGTHQLAEATKLHFMGLHIHQAGAATGWLKAVRQTTANTICPILRIATKAVGTRTEVSRMLVCAVLQLSLVYEAQFQRLPVFQRAKLKAVNREAMQAITGLPRITPIPVLQEQAQLSIQFRSLYLDSELCVCQSIHVCRTPIHGTSTLIGVPGSLRKVRMAFRRRVMRFYSPTRKATAEKVTKRVMVWACW